MANKRTSRLAGLTALSFLWPIDPCLSQGGGPQIGRAIEKIEKSVREESLTSLPTAIRGCYNELDPNAGVENVAYCFGLDYIAFRLRQMPLMRFDSDSQRYLSSEKVLTRVNRALEARKIEQTERGPLIAFWTRSSLKMLRHVAMSKRSDVSQEASKINDAKAAVLKSVSDPIHARVSDMKVSLTPDVNGEPTEVVCGKISERTYAGAYSPARPFVYFVDHRTANYANGADDLDREIVKNFCAR